MHVCVLSLHSGKAVFLAWIRAALWDPVLPTPSQWTTTTAWWTLKRLLTAWHLTWWTVPQVMVANVSGAAAFSKASVHIWCQGFIFGSCTKRCTDSKKCPIIVSYPWYVSVASSGLLLLFDKDVNMSTSEVDCPGIVFCWKCSSVFEAGEPAVK